MMKRIYKWLLRLYPAAYRELFAAEMLGVFEDAVKERRHDGRARFALFLIREFSGLLIAAVCQRFAHRANAPGGLTTVHAPDELEEAQNLVTSILRRMEFAIAHHQFEQARFYSNEERKARENVRRLLEKRNREQPPALA
jgi:hypothetical protein